LESSKSLQQSRPVLLGNDERKLVVDVAGFNLPDMVVVHRSERDRRVVALHTLQTLVEAQALVDIHPVQELKKVFEVLPTGWEEARGNPTAVRLERIAVAIVVGTGKGFQDKDQKAADNTGVPKVVVGASWPSVAAGFHQCSQV